MLLKASNISKEYNNEKILESISLEIKQSHSLAITGLSGSGKSTLLSILGLLLKPTSGEVFYCGDNVTKLSDKKQAVLRNREFGFIFQSCQLIGSLRVLDNVLVPGFLARKKGLEKRAKEILFDLGLEDKLYHYPSELSIGQKRRVSIARALILDPKIIFADEPTNDLDPKMADFVGDYLLNIPEKGSSLVVVTHDLTLANKTHEKVSIINRCIENNI